MKYLTIILSYPYTIIDASLFDVRILIDLINQFYYFYLATKEISSPITITKVNRSIFIIHVVLHRSSAFEGMNMVLVDSLEVVVIEPHDPLLLAIN